MADSAPAFAPSPQRSTPRSICDPIATEALAARPRSAAKLAFEAQGGSSRFELPSTSDPIQRDLAMGSAGFAIDLTQHRYVRPFLTFGGGYAEDITTDAAGAIQDPFAQVGGGLKIGYDIWLYREAKRTLAT